jgi:hypothetical protein
MWRRILIVLAFALLTASAAAQPGPAEDALPGAHRVGSAHLGERVRLSAIGWGSYGWIPGLDGEGGDHHRASGAASIALVPIRYFGATIGARGRWDVHPDDDAGADASGVGSFSLGLRGAVPLGELAIGGDASWELHGMDAPDITIEASRLALRGLASLRPSGWAFGFDLALGYRFDGTAASVVRPEELRQGDLVSLGASSFAHSVLFGLGVVCTIDPAELFFEATFEPYLDADPDVAPIRLALGARALLVSELRAHVVLEVTAHRRLPATADGPFTPAEPRVALWAGLSFSPAFDSPPAAPEVEEPPREENVEPVSDPPVEPPVEPEPPAPAGAIRGLVRDFSGAPVDAEITIEPGAVHARTDEDGLFEVEVPPAEYRVSIRAPGFAPQERTVSVTENEVVILNADLRRAR